VAVVLLISALVFSGCSLPGSSDSKTATSVSSTGGPITNGQSGTPVSGEASPTPMKVAPIVLAPPILVAQASSGTQDGNYGSYYWMIDSGLADKAVSRGIEIQKDPLKVKKGENVTFSWKQQNSESDSTLTDLSIRVYSQETALMTAVSSKGNLKGFTAQGSPVTSGPLPKTNPTWAANLNPGQYFVDVNASWSNPIVKDKPRNCEYGFFLEVD
jgi:hypothetical protein